MTSLCAERVLLSFFGIGSSKTSRKITDLYLLYIYKCVSSEIKLFRHHILCNSLSQDRIMINGAYWLTSSASGAPPAPKGVFQRAEMRMTVAQPAGQKTLELGLLHSLGDVRSQVLQHVVLQRLERCTFVSLSRAQGLAPASDGFRQGDSWCNIR
jgi:hypothetical protein